MEEKKSFGFSAAEGLISRVNKHLGYNDSRSEWIREAIELRLMVLEELPDDLDDPEEQREYVREAIRRKDD